MDRFFINDNNNNDANKKISELFIRIDCALAKLESEGKIESRINEDGEVVWSLTDAERQRLINQQEDTGDLDNERHLMNGYMTSKMDDILQDMEEFEISSYEDFYNYVDYQYENFNKKEKQFLEEEWEISSTRDLMIAMFDFYNDFYLNGMTEW